MKKLLLVFAFTLLGVTSSFSQGSWNFGVNGGIPVGDVEEFTTFHLGTDIAYRFSFADMFEVGPMVGYSHYFGDEVTVAGATFDYDDIQFLPVAASARLNFVELFYLGADLGYAVGINDGNDGGFYYRPLVGVDLGLLGINVSYSGVSMDGGSVASVNLGVDFGI
ncbi:hypothetical protein [Salegentibacter chungangensis]|uniref:Outer membrane protein beta-barrel domain-containing protein n=1 Tax=Salegentibacter chungangensis TaxID=1335724 RepID=A0ABW3NUG3_9FLAO